MNKTIEQNAALVNIVPPLGLCIKIPAGMFAESALVCLVYNGEITIGTRKRYEALAEFFPVYPAPTLQEIMASVPYCRVYKKTNGSFVAVHEKTRICHINGAAAALKLWLKLKGIKYE